jgi:diacylglycerol kinase family enzyme
MTPDPQELPTPAFKRALVIVNAGSGKGCAPGFPQELERLFAGAGIAAEIVLAHGGDALLQAARRGASEGFDLVVAGGGDGTQSAVASCLAHTQVVQGVLALGTLNHFAKDLHIPLKLEDAVRTLAEGVVTEVDVGEVNGRIFVNNSSLGIYPEIVRERELQRQRLGKSKWRALASATLHALRRNHGLAVRVESEDESQLRRTPFVFVGNNAYVMEGFAIGGRESLRDGVLALYMGRHGGAWALLRLAWRALTHSLAQADDFLVVTGPAFVITTRHRRLRVATDGEITLMDTPLTYRVRPRALRVVVPASVPVPSPDSAA